VRPAERAVTSCDTVWPALGVGVDDGTVKKDPLGQAGDEVPR